MAAAEDACSWMVEYRKGRDVTPAFITGTLSVAWTFLRLTEMTGAVKWREHALKIVKDFEVPKLEEISIDDLLNGISGTALALTMIHEKTGEDWILAKIEPMVELLIRRAWMGKKGLYWDRNEKEIKGLCGITHGAAGMGHAFTELGYYFKNPAFFELTHQAFAYETDLFSEEEGAWPDMRKGIFNEKDLEEHVSMLEQDNLAFFTEPKYMDAWCHGSPGIGLTRIRAYEILKDPEYLAHYRHAAKRSLKAAENKGRSFTLCHGMFGDLEMLLEGYRVLGEERFLDDALVDRAISFWKSGKPFVSGFMALNPPQEGKGMFMGNAGIGYSLLRWSDPNATETVLAPRVQAPCKKDVHSPMLNLDRAAIYRMLLEKPFARSLKRMDAIAPDRVSSFLNGLQKCPNIGEAFMTFMDEACKSVEGEQGEMLQEIFQLESDLFKMDQACPSLALVNSRQISHGQVWAARGETSNPTDLLVLDPDVDFKETQWDWTQEEPVREDTHILVKVMPEKVLETSLSDFTFEILNCFREPCTSNNAADRILSIFELEDPSEAEQVKQLTFQQIQEALKSGMLLFAK